MRSPDYTSIVNARHFDRLTGYLDEARARGAEIVTLTAGAAPDPSTRRIPPTIVRGAPDDARLTREEIGSYLGLKLETVSRLFSRFQEEGLIQVQGRSVKLLDPVALKRIVGHHG